MSFELFDDMKRESRNTEWLLHQISYHIASRKSMRNNIIKVQIDDKSNQSVKVTPTIQVYPDRYHKKQSDLRDVLVHVGTVHCSEMPFEDCRLVPGEYIYDFAVNKKRRRWRKV